MDKVQTPSGQEPKLPESAHDAKLRAPLFLTGRGLEGLEGLGFRVQGVSRSPVLLANPLLGYKAQLPFFENLFWQGNAITTNLLGTETGAVLGVLTWPDSEVGLGTRLRVLHP